MSATGPCSPLAAGRAVGLGAGAVFSAVRLVGCLGEWAGMAVCLPSPRPPAAVKPCAPGAWPITQRSQGAVAPRQPERARAARAERQPACPCSLSDSAEPSLPHHLPPAAEFVGLGVMCLSSQLRSSPSRRPSGFCVQGKSLSFLAACAHVGVFAGGAQARPLLIGMSKIAAPLTTPVEEGAAPGGRVWGAVLLSTC